MIELEKYLKKCISLVLLVLSDLYESEFVQAEIGNRVVRKLKARILTLVRRVYVYIIDWHLNLSICFVANLYLTVLRVRLSSNVQDMVVYLTRILNDMLWARADEQDIDLLMHALSVVEPRI